MTVFSSVSDAKLNAFTSLFTDPVERVAYILPIFLLKYLNELKIDCSSEVVIQNGCGGSLKLKISERADFYLWWKERGSLDVGVALNNSLSALAQDNLPEMDGLFNGIDYCSPRLGNTPDRLRKMGETVKHIGTMDLNRILSTLRSGWVLTDLVLHAKGARSSDRNMLEFATPEDVAILLASILEPISGERAYDPACGSGRLLLSIAAEASIHAQSNIDIYGAEKHYATWVLAKLNHIFSGYSSSGLSLRDSITPLPYDELTPSCQYDILVSNPPKGARRSGDEVAPTEPIDDLGFGIAPKLSGDTAFILHMVRRMKYPTGRMAVIVPDGVLFRQGADATVRELLLAKNLIDAVIALPARILVNTSLPMSVLILRATPNLRGILFVDARGSGKDDGIRHVLREETLTQVVETYRSRKKLAGFSDVASATEIAENNFSLLPKHYVEPLQEASLQDLRLVLTERLEIEKRLKTIDMELDAMLGELLYSDSARVGTNGLSFRSASQEPIR